jgi:predicted GNAT family acetyltransferase
MADTVEIKDNPDRSRYELRENGELAGFAEYRLHDGRITFTHTEVDDEHSRHGLGGRLARAALDDAIARRLQVVPRCPFIARVVRNEPDRYLEAVAPGMRSRVMEG